MRHAGPLGHAAGGTVKAGRPDVAGQVGGRAEKEQEDPPRQPDNTPGRGQQEREVLGDKVGQHEWAEQTEQEK